MDLLKLKKFLAVILLPSNHDTSLFYYLFPGKKDFDKKGKYLPLYEVIIYCHGKVQCTSAIIEIKKYE